MTVLNDTNRGRVSKIVETLSLIQKSATSNNATGDEMWELLGPCVPVIEEMLQGTASGTAEPKTEAAATHVPDSQKNARWFDIMTMAQEAPLDELTRAMAVYLNRIDEHLAK